MKQVFLFYFPNTLVQVLRTNIIVISSVDLQARQNVYLIGLGMSKSNRICEISLNLVWLQHYIFCTWFELRSCRFSHFYHEENNIKVSKVKSGLFFLKKRDFNAHYIGDFKEFLSCVSKENISFILMNFMFKGNFKFKKDTCTSKIYISISQFFVFLVARNSILRDFTLGKKSDASTVYITLSENL